MGLLDAYQDSTDRALTVMAARPIDPEPPKPKHSGWSTIPRAVAGAFVETAGNIMDVASAYGQVAAATGANANPLIPDSPEDRKQRLEAFDKLKTDGINWRSEDSQAHYQMARDLRPDPITSGAAENIVFGLTKGLTKAIGAGMIAGPVAGAGAFGVSEGMTTSEDLAAQGVDPATRQKVGVVTGAMSAAGMALPVAGSTLAKTAALVAVGGPASFVAQQAATRAILENADYGKLAQQYDPLDPVGLALATLLPAGFATWAKAGAISAAMKGKPKVAADPAAMTPEPIRPTATQDQVDAAMVHNLTLARDAHEAVPIEAVQAALAPVKVGAGDTATARPDFDQFAQKYVDSQPVDKFDHARQLADAEAEIRNDYMLGNKDGGQFFEQLKKEDAARFFDEDGDLTDAGNVRYTELQDQAVAKEALDQIGEPQQKQVDFSDPEHAAQILRDYLDAAGFDPNVVGGSGKSRSKYFEIENGKRMIRVSDHELPDHYVNDSDIEVLLPQDSAEALAKIKAIAAELVASRESTPTPDSGELGSRALSNQDAGAVSLRADESGQLTEPAQSGSGAGSDAKATGESGKQQDPHIASTLSRVEALKAQSPDLPVALREDGTPVTLAEELDAIRRQAREGTADTFGADDAPLIQVAVECMLSMGAA